MDQLRQKHKISPATHVRQSAAADVQYTDTWVAGSVFREITLIDNGLTDDPEKFVTEIRIPVQRIWEA